MNNFLIVTALLEFATGLALAVLPSLPVSILIGVSLDTSGELLGRVAGAALLSLGMACWFARSDSQSRAAQGLIFSLFIYNVGVSAILIYARAVLGLSGVGLWSALLIHGALAIWCMTGVFK